MKIQYHTPKNLFFATTLFVVLLIQAQNLHARTPPISYSASFSAFNHDSSELIYLSNFYGPSKLVKISTSDGKLLKAIPLKIGKEVRPFAATPDGYKLLATSPKGIAVIHNGTGKILRTLPYPTKNVARYVSLFKQSSDGVFLAIPAKGSKSRNITIIHTGSGKIIHTIDLLKDKKETLYQTIQGISFSPTRRYLAYAVSYEEYSRKQLLTIYDIYQRKEVLSMELPEYRRGVGKIQFSKNGQNLFFSDPSFKQVFLLNIKKRSLKTMTTTDYFDFVAFTPNGKQLIMVQSRQDRILLKNIKTGKTQINQVSFFHKDGYFDAGQYQAAQNSNQSLLIIPLRTHDLDKINNFILINTHTGKLFRQISKPLPQG